MTRKDLETAGHLKVQFANGKVEKMPYGTWKGVVWIKGPYNLLTVKDLEELSKKKRNYRDLQRRLTNLKARLVKVGPTQTGSDKQEWYKPVDVPAVTKQKIEESDFSPAGKKKLREIIASAKVARFKNDCGDLGPRFVHHIEGGVHPPVRQYPLNPGAVEEMDKIVKELGSLGIIREELNPITNSPIQAVKKPESAGGGWRPVINFKALNRRTIANRASLINPQGTLKTLRVKKFKSCIDLANGFFSLRLARQSQGKTAFTHKGKSYVWQRLPQGYKNSPNVFQSAVMEVLGDVGATVYIDDVFIADDTEEEHLERLRKVIENLTKAGLKLNLKKCQFGQFQVNYLGFQVTSDLGLSDGYREKMMNIQPPQSENELQKILGLCNYVRDHVPNYQKYAKPLYNCLKKSVENEGGGKRPWVWTAANQRDLEDLKKAIQAAVRLEPRSLSDRLVAEINCEEDDAMIKVSNENGGLVTLWSYTLTSVEKKYPQEEKELAVLARYWSVLKDLAQGQPVKVITQSQVHKYLRKGTVESTKATNARWGRWEDILLDPELEIGPAQPTNKKRQQETPEKPGQPEWTLYTDGSKKESDQVAYWGFILKQDGKERCRQKGKAPGSAQAGEVTAILEGLLELGKRKIKSARLVTDSYYCAQALKEDLAIWEENGFETAKGKPVAHRDLWKKIAELKMQLELEVEHQRAHTHEGAHWRGNDEVDCYVQQRKIVFVGIEKWDSTPRGREVPEEYVDEVVRSVHEALGHAGVRPTRKELEEHELWIPVKQVQRVLRDCEVCGKYNAGRRGQRLEGLTIKSMIPWGSVCMDVAGPMGTTGKRGEKYLLVLVDSMSGFVIVKAARKANGSSVVGMLEQVCSALGIPKELRTDNGTHFRNAQVDQWCQKYGVMRVYSPPYTPQANGVVERTIGLVKSWIAKNANDKGWSTMVVEIGQALNDRNRAERPAPSMELNQRPFTTKEVGRGSSDKKEEPTPKVPFRVGQRVWVKAREQPVSAAVKPKFETKDIVKQVLDRNTVLLEKKGIQGVEQLKPVPD
ncbi:endogenous retrovirus group K member 19 Pol protein-like [Poecilia latipinna]|uniref:endogenous retrovirus group K member 19 Pol protein-like n=1 Tax=Poecilia latipinna TaxID=48699 RepID=UPI00072E69D3|nr:PREDICTED: endogenous retrovirus group K member 19 Pol protein-like [Poecilia latipinna]